MTGASNLPIVIVGAGFSGLGASIELERAGHDSFIIFEAEAEAEAEAESGLGGTWRANTYPGCSSSPAS